MLRHIPVEFLQETWPIVLPGLEKVSTHSCEADTTEQIERALLQGAAYLLLAITPEANYEGFIILRPEQSFTGRKNLHIWAVFSKDADLDKRLPEIETLAKSAGFETITFAAFRKGWRRRMKSFEPTYQLYRKVLK